MKPPTILATLPTSADDDYDSAGSPTPDVKRLKPRGGQQKLFTGAGVGAGGKVGSRRGRAAALLSDSDDGGGADLDSDGDVEMVGSDGEQHLKKQGAGGGAGQQAQAPQQHGAMTVILFEEADLLLDEDKGFAAALAALIMDTKVCECV